MSPRDPDIAFKTLARALIDRVGGLEAAASCVRVRRAQLGNYQNVHDDTAFMPVDVLARLERTAGEPLLTAELARRAGCALVPVHPLTDGELAALLAKVGAESGQLFAAYAEALRDNGKVDEQEKAEIAREASDLIRAATAVLGHLNGTASVTPIPGRIPA